MKIIPKFQTGYKLYDDAQLHIGDDGQAYAVRDNKIEGTNASVWLPNVNVTLNRNNSFADATQSVANQFAREVVQPTLDAMGTAYHYTLGQVPLIGPFSEKAGTVQSIPQMAGFVRSGKAPWSPNNRGFGEYTSIENPETWNTYANVGSILLCGKMGKGVASKVPTVSRYAVNGYVHPAIRLIQEIGDRHKGMDYATMLTKQLDFFNDSFSFAKSKFKQKYGGNPAEGIGTGVYDETHSAFFTNNHPTVEPNGRTSVAVHLGGNMTDAGVMTDINNMSRTNKLWTARFVNELPEGTQIGESGITYPYAEQYLGTKPSWMHATIDAVRNKKLLNNEYVQSYREILDDPKYSSADRNFIKELHRNNDPLSMDSYKQMLLMSKKGKFDLTYDSTPMGFFNEQGNLDKGLYNRIKNLPPEQQVTEINTWIKSIDPHARLAYLKNGELQIPRLILVKKKK